MSLLVKFKKRFGPLIQRILPDYETFLSKDLVDNSVLLDLGCGDLSCSLVLRLCLSDLKGVTYVGADIYRPYLEKHGFMNSRENYVLCDASLAPFADKSVDTVILGSIIEHLSQAEGFHLISLCERIARKKIILIVPNGYCPQEMYDDNTYQRHLSAWNQEILNSLGFRTKGIHGLKYLRGDIGVPKLRPSILGKILCRVTQLLVLNMQDFAFDIYCTKELNNMKREK
jgi:hypothetical protein